MEKDSSEDPVIEQCVDSVIELLGDGHHSELESLEQFQEKARIQVREGLQDYRNRLTHGYEVLLEELDRENQNQQNDSSYLPGLLRP